MYRAPPRTGGSIMIALPDADLLQAYLDCRLAAAEVAALEGRLLREPAFADALMTLAREEAVLTEWARAARVADSATEKTAGGVLDRAPATTWPTLPSWPRRAMDRRQATAYLLSAAAAVLLAVVGVALRQHSESAFLADLEEVQGDVSIITASGVIIPA